MFDEYTYCINLDEDWWIKIINNYGIVDYINIKNNLVDPDSIEHVEDLFEHLILPPDKQDQYGNLITWEILDYENIYTLNELPEKYLNKTENPQCCFDSESESSYDLRMTSNISNYFDTTIIDF